MKFLIYYFVTILMLVSYVHSNAQNLVTDGSFENYLFLPESISTHKALIDHHKYYNCYQDYVMNCLCDRGLNVTFNYPKDSTRWNICNGWLNPSYYLWGYGQDYSSTDYFNEDVDSSTCFGKSFLVDVPINFTNLYRFDFLNYNARFLTYPHHGK